MLVADETNKVMSLCVPRLAILRAGARCNLQADLSRQDCNVKLINSKRKYPKQTDRASKRKLTAKSRSQVREVEFGGNGMTWYHYLPT